MGFDPASRFSLVDQAAMMPGKCLITGTTTGKFVDTGMSINKFDGIYAEANNARIYISVDAIREMAIGAGILDEAFASSERKKEEHRAEGFLKGVGHSVELSDLVSSLNTATGVLSSAIDLAGPEAPGTDGLVEPAVFVTDGVAEQGGGKEGRGKPSSNRQGNVPLGLSRPARLPSNSGHANAGRAVS